MVPEDPFEVLRADLQQVHRLLGWDQHTYMPPGAADSSLASARCCASASPTPRWWRRSSAPTSCRPTLPNSALS